MAEQHYDQKNLEEYRQRIRALENHLNALYEQTCAVEQLLKSLPKA